MQCLCPSGHSDALTFVLSCFADQHRTCCESLFFSALPVFCSARQLTDLQRHTCWHEKSVIRMQMTSGLGDRLPKTRSGFRGWRIETPLNCLLISVFPIFLAHGLLQATRSIRSVRQLAFILSSAPGGQVFVLVFYILYRSALLILEITGHVRHVTPALL